MKTIQIKLNQKPFIIGKELGFTDLTELHNDWIKKFILSQKDYTLLAHRGSYKTTCLTLAMSFLMILFPNKNIIFLRKTDTDVKEVLRQVHKIMSSNLFKYLVGKIYNINLDFPEVSAFNLTTNLVTTNKGTSQLIGLGVKTSITGKHADIVITDDIVNVKDRISKAERDLTKTAYMELQNIKNRGGRILNTGTTWHKEGAISLMPNVSVFDCYNTDLIDRKTLEEIRQANCIKRM